LNTIQTIAVVNSNEVITKVIMPRETFNDPDEKYLCIYIVCVRFWSIILTVSGMKDSGGIF
jgi:hypothetical protein